MLYIASDLHGEYGLFVRLLEKIGFSDGDRMIICGDIVDKGPESIRLARLIFSMPNVECILGNHEHAFLKYYESLMRRSPEDFDEVLERLRGYFREDGHLLDWETVDRFESLPLYVEEDDFICVHAGLPIGADGKLPPLSSLSAEQLVHDRRFKDPDLRHASPKCVFFGHTQTDAVCGSPIVIGYPRDRTVPPRSVADFYKIHLDTGTWSNGVMSCFCVDSLSALCVRR